MKRTTIYVLKCPKTDAVRYVGKTTMRLCARLAGHMRCNPNTRSGRWCGVLTAQGLRPTILAIEVVPTGGDWAERERHWIRHYRSLGAKLTNVSEGGDGHNGFFTAESTREKLSTAGRKRRLGPEFAAKLSAAFKGRVITPEARAKIAAALRGRPLSAEQRDAISRANKGRRLTVLSPAARQKISERAKARGPLAPEHRAALSAAMRGMPGRAHSAETRKKIGEAQRGKKRGPLSDEHKAKISAAQQGRPANLIAVQKAAEVNRGRKLTEEHKAKCSAALKGRTCSPETRAKIGAANKLRAAERASRSRQALLL